MSTDERVALYLYGFTRAGAVQGTSVPGISGADDVAILQLGEIAAVTSPLSMEEFRGADGEDRTLDLDWVAPRALRHQAVVEEVMESAPVLPLTFGVIFSSPRALEEAVGPRLGQIGEFLDFIEGKQEWAIKVYADAQRLRDFVGRSAKFRQRREQLPDSPGARYFHEKRLQRELERLAVEERRDMAERIRQELAPEALAVKSLRLSSREVTGRRDEMVLNAAFLAESDHLEEFIEHVHKLADEYEPAGLTIEATGPWPPYSFGPSLQVQQ